MRRGGGGGTAGGGMGGGGFFLFSGGEGEKRGFALPPPGPPRTGKRGFLKAGVPGGEKRGGGRPVGDSGACRAAKSVRRAAGSGIAARTGSVPIDGSSPK